MSEETAAHRPVGVGGHAKWTLQPFARVGKRHGPARLSTRYNITALGLERLHPFDSRKYRRIRDWLVRQGLRKPRDFIAPRPCTHADLLRVHAPEYLRSLRDRRVLARILEVPVIRYLPAWLIAWRVLRPMRWATGGTVLVCRLALVLLSVMFAA